MTLPGEELSINDPGMASSEPATMRPLFLGYAAGGSEGTPSSLPGTVGSLDLSDMSGTSVVSVHANPAPDGTYAIVVAFPTGGTVGVAGMQYQVSLNGGGTFADAAALGTANYLTVHGVRFDLGTGTIGNGSSFSIPTTGPTSVYNGDLNTLTVQSSPTDVVAQYGEGRMPEVASFVLANGGGPALCMRTSASVAAVIGAVTKTAIGTSTGTITVAGTPYDDAKVRVEITTTGTLGAGSFRYTLDRSDMRDSSAWTWSEAIRIPAGGSYAVSRAGVTILFVPGAGAIFFEDGDIHDFDLTGPKMNATDLQNAMTAILASKLDWRFAVVCSQPATASAGAAFFAALAVHMTSLESTHRYRRAMVPAGSDTADNVATQYASQFSTRILVAYGDADLMSAKAFVGKGVPRQSILSIMARNATGPRSLGWGIPSTDLKRVKGGPAPGIASKANGNPAITHDEFKTNVLDALGIATMRTYPSQKLGGAYVTQGRLKSQPGSDFTRWDLGIVMDIACEKVIDEETIWTGDDIRTNDDGSIYVPDAERIEGQVNAILRAELMAKPRANGLTGYVQDVLFVINRSADVLTDGYITAEIGIKPLRKIEGFRTAAGYVRQPLQIPLAQ